MSNAEMVKSRMHELASQVYILATGLQNAAPGSPGKSVQYLLETASQLEKTSNQVEKLIDPDSSLINLRPTR